MESELLEDSMASDFGFFADYFCHMNKLNIKMQGKIDLSNLNSAVNKDKLKLYEDGLRKFHLELEEIFLGL